MPASTRRDASTTAASTIGVAVGVGVLALYLVAGVVGARWDLADAAAHLTPADLAEFLLLSVLAVATFAVPVAAYLRLRVVVPAGVLAAVLLGWTGYGLAAGILTPGTVFGLGLYVVSLAPLYLVGYAVLGGAEYYVRNRT